ncbi:hypothetical protein BDR26DRAFT_553998 [Obelidium mucronatum]|nr:hypothetical protein BDR26DRAFT_553998 [Obelidium mucronatum]
MCGRTVLFASQEQVEAAAQTKVWSNNPPSSYYKPSYNSGPMRLQPVITRTCSSSTSSSSTSSRTLSLMQWGIKTNTHSLNPTLSINARDDTLISSASTTWNSLKNSHRAVVVSQGFFEWLEKPTGSTNSVPFFVCERNLVLKKDRSDDVSTTTATTTSSFATPFPGFLFYACLYQEVRCSPLFYCRRQCVLPP